jgi:uncharacterized protein (TIGR02246 family)
MHRRTALVGVAMLLVGVMASSAQSPAAEIQKVADQYVAAYNKGDAKALAALYTADALRLGAEGQLVTGRAAIEQYHGKNLAGPFKGTKLIVHSGKTQSLTADVAVSEGTYEITGGPAPAKGRYQNTLLRQDGQWRLASVVIVPATPPSSK